MEATPLKYRILSAIGESYLNEGRRVFWPSNFKNFLKDPSSSEQQQQLLAVLWSLVDDEFLQCTFTLECPEGHEVVSGARVFASKDFFKRFELFSEEECPECDFYPVLGDFDPDECGTSFRYGLRDWYVEVLKKKKTSPWMNLPL